MSVALYGCDGRLCVGIDADSTAMPDVPDLRKQLARSFEEVIATAQRLSRASGIAPARFTQTRIGC